MTTQTLSTIIIGAGAAGLAAARTLYDAGRRIRILEARDRIGGRIHTDYDFASVPLELGAEFIHGEHAMTHQLVRQAGLHTIPVVRMDNLWWPGAEGKAVHRAQLPPHLADTITRLLADYDALRDANLPQDMSLAAYLRMRGWEADDLQIAETLLAQTCCATLDSLSCHDHIREMQLDRAGSAEARIREGYGALLNWYSRDLPIHLNTPVNHIQWGAEGVTVIAGEDVFTAATCIITVPVSILQRNDITFDPPLSDDKQWAIDAMRTAAATKLIYRFDERFWSDDLTYIGHTGLTARWWTPAYGHEADVALLCAFVTADRARTIDALPEANAIATGLDALSTLLGLSRATLDAHLAAARRVSWAHDHYAGGGYAHIPPGKSDARTLLAQPEGRRLFFAGEATAHHSNPQTVHGAIESGIRAAHECIDNFSA
ncbi:MAG: FAD-dependent oxidoreductase [Chloroflexi bacterium]|nr:MAG: FAD-dependent oxidoreductase [Chloroflexota bacterium]